MIGVLATSGQLPLPFENGEGSWVQKLSKQHAGSRLCQLCLPVCTPVAFLALPSLTRVPLVPVLSDATAGAVAMKR